MPDPIVHPVNILEVLDGIPLPASKEDVVVWAEDHDASEAVLEQLRAMPGDEFKSIADINRRANLLEVPPGADNIWT
jgi:hypothetical protein